MVANFLQGNYHELARFPFEKFRMSLSDGSIVEVRMEESLMEGERIPSRKRLAQASPWTGTAIGDTGLHIEYIAQDGKREVFRICKITTIAFEPPKNTANSLELTDQCQRQTPSVGTGQWWEEVSLSAVGSELESVRMVREQVPIHFVETQRLSRFTVMPLRDRTDGVMTMQAVQAASTELAEHIKKANSEYSAISTRLDDTLPSRLFASLPGVSPIQEDELETRNEALEEERRRLQRIGLIGGTTHFSPGTLNETQRAMFAVYLEDREKKLRVFKDLADRAEILLDVINHKFAPKKIKIDSARGYSVYSHDDRPLELDVLSSGEQHELLLLHSLLFRVKSGSLLLIDEPEISLHVTWQDEFLEDLIKIAKKVGFDALVATHSPYIVGSRRDLMVRLGEPVAGESA